MENTAAEARVTGAVRYRAEELGVVLITVEGTDANGYITVGDVANAAQEEDGEAG
ncbi:MAG: E3 binding domain-containing protein [Rubrobacter sp.]|nr:E3 binding domain-containing protein [Rubrobacter sp.]